MSPVIVVENHLDEIASLLKEGAGEVTLKTAEWIAGETKRSMSEEKTGRVYSKKGGKEHVASASGEAPAIDMGFLVNSIDVAQSDDKTSATVFTPVEYAVPLEFGSARAASRPFFTPAAFKAAEVAFNLVQKMVGDIQARFSSGQ